MNSERGLLTSDAQESGSRLGVVNGLRGVAILGVIYQHLFVDFTPACWRAAYVELPSGHAWPIPVWAFLSNGWLGVNLFFVLSGFVLFRPYANGWREMNSRADWGQFYRRRWRRLMPLYYFSVVIALLAFYWVTYFQSQLDGEQWPEYPVVRDLVLMATVTFPLTTDMWYPRCNWVLWTLGIEIWYSLLFPLLVVLIRKFGMGWVYSASVLTALAVRVANVYFGGGFRFEILDPVRDSLPGRLDDFVTGMFVAFLVARRGRDSSDNRSGRSLAMVVSGIGLMFLGAATWDWYLEEYLPVGVVPYLNLFVNIGAGLLLTGLLTMPPCWTRWLFSNRPIQLIGMMCFSIYVWHGLLILWLLGDPHQITDTAEYVVRFLLIYIPVLAVVTVLSYRFIEFRDRKQWRPLFQPVRDR